ncbi:MAG: HAMP domain-containing histidine kinase [Sphingobacteriales bacterium]|nr:MAG: HAMP domain-containing histidine kinase [Sphingobacteriales bacterium]
MFSQIFNWRTGLAIIAILIVSGTIFYSNFLANKIAREERQKVEQCAEALRFLATSPSDADTRLASLITTENKTVPIIETNERDSITGTYINLDSGRITNDPHYLADKLQEFKSLNKPVEVVIGKDPSLINRYYYGQSLLLQQVKYYPIIQLIIVALFIIITIFSITIRNKSTQNQVWAGMAKETAHQLGTPVTSLEGWVEMLKENSGSEKIAHEMEKDVYRLKLVSERFGKIGSTPQLEEHNIIQQVQQVMDYMKKRAAGKVHFSLNTYNESSIPVKISPQLFDWVLENLLKNALDAMEGKGKISVEIKQDANDVIIEIKDSGKGISRQNISLVFKPGFTTKKRGWGLGLSLSKRIVEQYHKGKLFVKWSEVGKGTCFRIELKK